MVKRDMQSGNRISRWTAAGKVERSSWAEVQPTLMQVFISHRITLNRTNTRVHE